jgi:hypothetical protein
MLQKKTDLYFMEWCTLCGETLFIVFFVVRGSLSDIFVERARSLSVASVVTLRDTHHFVISDREIESDPSFPKRVLFSIRRSSPSSRAVNQPSSLELRQCGVCTAQKYSSELPRWPHASRSHSLPKGAAAVRLGRFDS